MKSLRSALLYTLLAIGAIPATSMAADPVNLEALRIDDMRKLAVHSEPRVVSDVAFEKEDGSSGTLQDYLGKHVLVNFWATWCAPCREEMPALAALQNEYKSDTFEVVTIATGRNPVPALNRFFDEIDVSNLPLHRDPRQALARDMAVLGLPVTLIIDPEGREIARLIGGAEWDGESARALITALIEPPE